MKYLIGIIIGATIALAVSVNATTMSASVKPNKCNACIEACR